MLTWEIEKGLKCNLKVENLFVWPVSPNILLNNINFPRHLATTTKYFMIDLSLQMVPFNKKQDTKVLEPQALGSGSSGF